MFELGLELPAPAVEAVSERLLDELGALSVTVEDAASDDAKAIFGEPGLPPAREGWERSLLRALFDSESAADAAAAVLSSGAAAGGQRLVSISKVSEQDWVRSSQSQFEPIEIRSGFWIVPTWHAVPHRATKVLRVDPGLAFGTGTHATTRMCLRWIADHGAELARPDTRMLDYGCGSGILALAAALHGAVSVDAVDIDPVAVAATAANARANDLRVQAGSPEGVRGTYDVVVANILAAPLVLLAPVLAKHLAPGAWIVLAGLLDRQQDEVAAAYSPWVRLEVADQDDGWTLLAGRSA